MRKVLTILTIILTLTLTLTGTLTVAAQTGRQLKVYIKGGLVDKVRVDGDASIGHSRTDLNGTVHDDFVSMVITDSEGRERQYLISQLDSLVMPNGRRVVFVGNVNGNVNDNENENQNENQNEKGSRSRYRSRSNQRRTSFEGEFPGTVGKNVTFFWTENDHIRLDVGDESRATNLTNDKKSASFIFEDADLDASSYRVYYPDKTVTILNVQTQTGADNTEHIGRSGDCGIGTARINGNDNENSPSSNTDHPSPTTYTFTLEHQAAYLCFLPHIDNLPSVKLTKITLSCSAAIAGTYLLRDNGLSDGTGTSTSITLNLNPLGENDFFIGHDVQLVQSDCAAYMVIAPQTANCDFTATYFVTDTLSRISKMYRQTFKLKPEANTVYPVTCRIADEEFRTIDLGLSCNWSNVNVGAKEPSLSGPGYATDADANAALLAQTVVTQWLLPDEDQRNELLTKCEWTAGEYNGASGYFVEGAAVAKEYGRKLRIFLPCTAGSTKAQCLAQNRRPVEALMVDLGLSSGTKWAVRNIGATSVEDYGNYYAWGEVEPKESYTSTTYKFGTTQNLGTGYDIGGSELDAAHVAWGGLWRMPTKDELAELDSACTWLLTTLHGVAGFIITGKGENPNKIFLPSAGYMNGTSLTYPSSYSDANWRTGSYWSSTQGDNASEYAWTLSWRSGHYSGTRYIYNNGNDYHPLGGNNNAQRYWGRTVRAVAKPNMMVDGMSLDISTDSTNWKFNTPTATLYGTLSSSTPITTELIVGFLVGDSANIKKGNERFDLSATTTSVGSFHQNIAVHDNIGYWYRAYIKVGNTYSYASAKHYGLEMVDLGLPSHTRWANMNVGANSPGEYGNYYAWGETATKSNYKSSTYKFVTTWNLGTDYDIAGSELDAAHVNWGGAWQMPTKTQLEELNDPKYCTWELSTEDNQTGFRITSKVNGNSIFLPSAGYMNGTNLSYPGSYSDANWRTGSYWSSTQGGTASEYAWTLSWRSGHYSGTRYIYNNGNDYHPMGGNNNAQRYWGRTIRAVAKPNAITADSVMNVLTDSAAWKFGQSVATLHATLSSTTPLHGSTVVGFITGNSKTIKHGDAGVVDYPQTIDVTGRFSQNVSVVDNVGQWYRAYVKIGTAYFYGSAKHYGLELVDLGLPSHTRWANMNVGASSPGEYGNYFAWGETEPKTNYTSSNYLGGSGHTALNLVEGLNIAWTEYDAAHANWGGAWQMPTKAQLEELNNPEYCTWEFSSEDNQTGFRITSTVNGNSIFLPSAGYMNGTNLYYTGSYSDINWRTGSYWSSMQGGTSSEYAWTLSWRSGHYSGTRYIYNNGNDYHPMGGNNNAQRYWGRTIRAVIRQSVAIVGDAVMEVTTDAPDWTFGQTTATIKGTLASNRTLTSDVTVGFLVKNHYYTDCATVKTYHDITVNAAGEFSLVQAIDSDEGLYYTAYIKVGDSYYYGGTRHAGLREMVNLDLPSGRLWANLNLGATTEDEVGDYFAWGETAPKTTFDADTYLLKAGDGYADLGSNISGTEYDAVHALWQGGWRMPTESDFSELVNNCDLSYVTVNGHPCYKAKSRVSDAYVLFPEGGIKLGDVMHDDNYWAFYWTSNNSGASEARRTNFYGQWQWSMHYDNRAYGLPIKAVADR